MERSNSTMDLGHGVYYIGSIGTKSNVVGEV